MRQRQHHRDIGARNKGHPLRLQELWQVITERAEEDELDTAFSRSTEVLAHPVMAYAAWLDRGVLEREPAKADE
jgi:hypothetical protein